MVLTGKLESKDVEVNDVYFSFVVNLFITMSGEQLLIGAGSVSHAQEIDKATEEYKKYQQKTLSQVEKDYLDTIKMIEDKTSDKH